MERPLPPARSRTARRYHHGNLREAALRCGSELVAKFGPDALTLRGLARELGVTAPALVYHFGSRAGLRSAVAESVLEAAERAAFARAPGVMPPPEQVGSAWIAFAEKNPLLYRLASGEGWRAQLPEPNGFDPGGLAVRSPRRVLQDEFARRSRGVLLPAGGVPRADRLASTIHGLALARLDGAGADVVAGVLRELGERPWCSSPAP